MSTADTADTADVIVIGMGPAGESVAGQLAEAGLDVVGIDRLLVGGECPYWGCVPSKMMIRAADLLAEARRIPGMAGTVTVTPDWAPVAARIRDEATDDWDDTVAVERFEDKGGRFVRGDARIVGPGTVDVAGHTIRASTGIVIATGTRPAVPPIPGLADTPFWTNHEAIEATQLPASIIVLGGGAIGAELAQVYARFGVEVDVVEAQDRLLPLDEPEAGALLAEVFGREGIRVHTGVTATEVTHTDGRFTVALSDGRTLDAERLLVATGRRTELAALGVESIGLDPSAKTLTVDEHLRVDGADDVWAVGDITGRGAFTHVGMYQAAIAVADILDRDHAPATYHALPRVTFTDPEIGVAGRTEADARADGVDVRTAGAQVPSTARGWIHKADGFIKLVADAASGTLVGATVAGPNGGEVMGLLALAIHAEVPVATLRTMMWAYPTFYRGIEDALRELDLD